jgi:hypothetical protein
MATATQFGFDLREATIALIKETNVREGKWWTAFELSWGSAFFGQTPADTFPGGFFQIRRIVLARAEENTPERFVVDAAEVWKSSSK